MSSDVFGSKLAPVPLVGNLHRTALACAAAGGLAIGAGVPAQAQLATPPQSPPPSPASVVTVSGCLQHDEHYGSNRSFVLIQGSMSPLGGPGRGDLIAPPSPPSTPEQDIPGEPDVHRTPPGTPGASRLDEGANGGGTGAGGVTYVLAGGQGLTKYLDQRLEVTGTLRLQPNRAAARTPKGLATMPPGPSAAGGTVPPGQTLDVLRVRPIGEPCS